MTMIDTPDGVAFFRIVALQQALKAQTQGLNVIGHGMTGTAIGKRDYGLSGQARTMLPKVEAYVAAVHVIREHMDARIGELFDFIGARMETRVEPHFGDEALGKAFSAEVNTLVDDGLVSTEDEEVLRALLTATLFERNAKPAVRVIFRTA